MVTSCRSAIQNVGRWLAGLVFPGRGKGDYVFGDGSPIPSSSLLAVRRAIRDETRTFDWRAGDVLLIDNILVSHGRRPYRGPRRVLSVLFYAQSSEPSYEAPEAPAARLDLATLGSEAAARVLADLLEQRGVFGGS